MLKARHISLTPHAAKKDAAILREFSAARPEPAPTIGSTFPLPPDTTHGMTACRKRFLAPAEADFTVPEGAGEIPLP